MTSTAASPTVYHIVPLSSGWHINSTAPAGLLRSCPSVHQAVRFACELAQGHPPSLVCLYSEPGQLLTQWSFGYPLTDKEERTDSLAGK